MSLTVVSTTNPVKVTGTCSSSAVILTGWQNIQSIMWENPTAAGDACNLVDANGNDIVSLLAQNPTEPVYVEFPARRGLPVNGVSATKMDSGTLLIYIA